MKIRLELLGEFFVVAVDRFGRSVRNFRNDGLDVARSHNSLALACWLERYKHRLVDDVDRLQARAVRDVAAISVAVRSALSV